MYERSAIFLDLSNHLNRFPSFRSVTPQHQDHSHRPIRNHGAPDIEDFQVKPGSCDDRDGYADSPHTDGRRHHDEVGVAGATERSGQTMVRASGTWSMRDDLQEKRPEFDDGFVAGKGANEHVRKKKKQHAH